MVRHRSLARGSAPSDRRSSVATTERLLDVLLDMSGVRAAFLVDDEGRLVMTRFAEPHPTDATMRVALDAVGRLQLAATSGLEAPSSVVALRNGLVFARRHRQGHLCALVTQQANLKALGKTARLVAAGLPGDACTLPAPVASWDDDDRATLPWRPEADDRGDAWAHGVPGASLRAPRVPRELSAEAGRGDEERASGIRMAPGARRLRGTGSR
jgi:hypothetical protein